MRSGGIAQLCVTTEETTGRTMVQFDEAGAVVRDGDGFSVDEGAQRACLDRPGRT